MNVLDLAIVAAIAFNAWGGMKVGLVMGVYQLIVLVVTVVAAIALQEPVGAALGPMLPVSPEIARLAVYVVILALLGYAFGLIGSLLLRPLIRKLRSTKIGGRADRVLGLIPGALRGVVYAGSLIFVARLVLPQGHQWRELLDTSAIAPVVVAVFERFYPLPRG